MHRLAASFVLGYHGCDSSIAERLLGGEAFKRSENDYDWLGHGIYFWEANPERGLQFAKEAQARNSNGIKTPTVVGAVIELGLCLDLTTSAGIQLVQDTYPTFANITKEAGYRLPQNSSDSLRRNLDCAVINMVHTVRKNVPAKSRHKFPSIDTVRGIFMEGERIYEGSSFFNKSHIQICVCNPDCIKGVFRVKDALSF